MSTHDQLIQLRSLIERSDVKDPLLQEHLALWIIKEAPGFSLRYRLGPEDDAVRLKFLRALEEQFQALPTTYTVEKQRVLDDIARNIHALTWTDDVSPQAGGSILPLAEPEEFKKFQTKPRYGFFFS